MSEKKKDALASRREFFQVVTAAATLAVPGLIAPARAESPASFPGLGSGEPKRSNVSSDNLPGSDIQFPRVFTGRKLARISLPLGGIGTGGIGLGGRGNLLDLDIFNRPNKGVFPESGRGNFPEFAFPAIWAKAGQNAAKSLILERRLLPPYDISPEGLGSDNVPGLPRLAEATFRGAFPLARIEFKDDSFPVQISLDAFSSFQPVDADLSGLPCAVLSYEVRNPGHQSAGCSDCVVARKSSAKDHLQRRRHGRRRHRHTNDPESQQGAPVSGNPGDHHE